MYWLIKFLENIYINFLADLEKKVTGRDISSVIIASFVLNEHSETPIHLTAKTYTKSFRTFLLSFKSASSSQKFMHGGFDLSSSWICNKP